ncbi:MAG: solute carrier family 23 protein, partial [Candidatus Binatia bacterium]
MRGEAGASSWRGDLVGGFTTFATMAYILFVNPAILSDPAGAGMDHGAVLAATAIAAAAATLLMGLLAGYPIAVAPGMGLNA